MSPSLIPAPESRTSTRTVFAPALAVRRTRTRLTSVRLSHGVHPVEDKVQGHLLQLHPVAQHGRKLIGQLEPDRDTADNRVAAHEPRHLAQRLVEVERASSGDRPS